MKIVCFGNSLKANHCKIVRVFGDFLEIIPHFEKYKIQFNSNLNR